MSDPSLRSHGMGEACSIDEVRARRATIHAAVLPEVLQRLTWNGTLKELGDLFVRHKNRRTAWPVIYTSQWGWEERLLVGS